MKAQPLVKRQLGISPLWTLPLLALILCGWLLYQSFLEAGIEIQVYFEDATGITPAKTQVMAMGLPLGIVTKMEPVVEERQVRVTIRMNRATEPYLVEDAKFWVVKPEISARRITGLDTILSGSYIGVQRGKSEVPARTFTALSSPPPLPPGAPGLHIKLRSDALRSIQKGSAIHFRNIKIGSVQSYQLEADRSILLDCHIMPEYQDLIKSGSRFYDASGITFSGRLTNLKIRLESLASLLVGGIVVHTPPALQSSPKARNGEIFKLYEDFEAADYGVSMQLKLASGSGITEGVTKVIYRGIEAGYVRNIEFNNDEQHSVTAHILLDPRAEFILREDTVFWMVSPELSLDGAKNLGSLLSGPYLTFKPGGGSFRDHFEILSKPPQQAPLRPGKEFFLSHPNRTPAAAGSPVLFHGLQIGESIGTELGQDRNSLVSRIFIYHPYVDLVHARSVFVASGGLTLEVGLSGFSASIGPLQSLLKGGVEVVNPVLSKPAPEAPEGSSFRLYADLESAFAEHPELRPEGLYFSLQAAEAGSSRPGSPILHKQVTVGQILDTRLTPDGSVRFSCFIQKRYAPLVTDRSQFFNLSAIAVDGSLRGLNVRTGSLETMISGGVGFYTEPGGKAIADGRRFNLHDSEEAARQNAKTEIIVSFETAERLSSGAPVRYRGIGIGKVGEVRLSQDLKSLLVHLWIEPDYAGLFRETTRIWLTRPRLDLAGPEHLETVLYGPAVAVRPGSGAPKSSFVGLARPPHPIESSDRGLHLVLEAKHLGSLEVDSPVYYRQVEVGRVTGYDLTADFRDVYIYLTIEAQYRALVRENTRFWNASGLEIEGGIFSGVSVSTQSLQALMTGGIALATPAEDEMGGPAYDGFHFRLHDTPDPSWLDWSPDVFMIEEERPQS